MYKVLAQLVLLYGINSWVLTGEMLNSLTEFHHRAAQQNSERMKYVGQTKSGSIKRYRKRWTPPHQSIHKEAIGKHSGEGVLPACICNVHRGGENAGDEPDGAMVGSRHGK